VQTFKYMFKRTCSMVVKTLTIKEKAYDALYGLKRENESFSDVILRLSEEKIGKTAQFFGVFKHDPEGMKKMRERICIHRAKIDAESAERIRKIRQRLG